LSVRLTEIEQCIEQIKMNCNLEIYNKNLINQKLDLIQSEIAEIKINQNKLIEVLEKLAKKI